ncbi:MAG: arginine--tRNA ligase, partial [Treponema sp.]|nr:arginine--tRNA ligase [Treponema sp.]
MFDYKEPWKIRISGALNALCKDAGLNDVIEAPRITAEIPPKPEMGDLGFPMFSYAKLLRKGPPQIARLVCDKLAAEQAVPAGGSFTSEGPYVNVRLDRGETAGIILKEILAENGGAETGEPGDFGRPGALNGTRIMVEFSSPNTNKPLHLGHLRNDVLGESVSRILRACGAEVRKVCIINDRGVHICKSMLAYKEHGENRTPESEGVKSDRFVGDWYVRFHKMSQEDPGAESRAQELLRKWEAGDAETVELWKKMNAWTIRGMQETYRRTGVSFDQYYYESQTYLLGKDEILKGLEKGVF